MMTKVRFLGANHTKWGLLTRLVIPAKCLINVSQSCGAAGVDSLSLDEEFQ